MSTQPGTPRTSVTFLGQTHHIRYDPLTKQGSVLDVIQLVTGCSQNNAPVVYSRLCNQFHELTAKCSMLKFTTGRGQRPTPVAHLCTLVEIAWLCPGKNAKEFRRTGATTLCRALGGDLSLVDDIQRRHAEVAGTEEQAAFLAGTGVTIAEANGSVDELAVEERRIAFQERWAAIRERRAAELVSAAAYLYKSAATTDDVRHRLMLQDGAKNIELQYIEVVGGKRLAIEGGCKNTNTPITISDVAAALGHSASRADLPALGKAVAHAYRKAHGGENPPKHMQYVDGAPRDVNSYFEKDRALIEECVRSFFI